MTKSRRIPHRRDFRTNKTTVPLQLGCSLDRGGFDQDESYRSLVIEHFDWVCPIWEMKWAWESLNTITIPTFHQAVRNWSRQTGIAVRGHSLLDGCMIPSWLDNVHLNGYFLWQAITDYLTRTLNANSHIARWDVANECFDEYGELRLNLWRNRLERYYLNQLYGIVREIAPADTKLFYCDFGIKLTEKWQAIWRWASAAHRAGILDGVAIQLHFNTVPGIPYRRIRDMIRRFQDVGLVVSAPECIVWNRKVFGQVVPGSETVQADAYLKLTQLLIEEGVTEIGYWTPFDQYGWVWNGETSCTPGLFGLDRLGHHTPKPMVESLKSLWAGAGISRSD